MMNCFQVLHSNSTCATTSRAVDPCDQPEYTFKGLVTGAYEYQDTESDDFAKVAVTLVFDSATGIVTLAVTMQAGFGPFSMAARMVGHTPFPPSFPPSPFHPFPLFPLSLPSFPPFPPSFPPFDHVLLLTIYWCTFGLFPTAWKPPTGATSTPATTSPASGRWTSRGARTTPLSSCKVGRVQVDSIKTRVESAYDIST